MASGSSWTKAAAASGYVLVASDSTTVATNSTPIAATDVARSEHHLLLRGRYFSSLVQISFRIG